MRLPPFPLPMAVVRNALDARRRLIDVADAGLPGEAALFDLVLGLQRTKIAGVLVTSGLADALGGDSRDPLDLARELGLDPGVTVRIVHAAVASRLVRLDRNGYARLTSVGAPLRADHPHSLGLVGDFPRGSGERRRLRTSRRSVARGSGTVRDQESHRDVAVGVLRRASGGRGHLRARGLADRIDRRPGDLFGQLDARADVYTMKWILHDWSDDACRNILARVRATMPTGSKLVVIDQHRESDRPNPLTPMTDVLMLVMCEGGRERSPEEVHGLMRDAGLKPGRVRHSGLTMLVEGSRARS
jgi:O-methyltransferase domain